MTVLGAFILGVLMEVVLVLYLFKNGEVEIMFKFSSMGDWVICDSGSSEVFSEEIVGVSALYSYGVWIVMVTGWSLFVGVLVILEITRGA